MSRPDFLFALGVALGKDREVTRNTALTVIAKAVKVPAAAYPDLTHEAVTDWYEWLLGHQEPPRWVLEALQNVTAKGTLLHIAVDLEGASETWWKSAKVLYRPGESGFSRELNRMILHGLAGRPYDVEMNLLDWKAIQEWVKTVPGDNEDEQPFRQVEDDDQG